MDTVSQPISQPRTKRRYRSAEERRRIVEAHPGVIVTDPAIIHWVTAVLRQLGLAGVLHFRSFHEVV